MNLNEAFSIVISHLISEGTNKEYIEKLETILQGIKDKKYIEQKFHPAHQSVLLFGYNIFTFKDADYISMANVIKG